MNNLSTAFALFVFSLVPYSVASWIYMKLTQGESSDFWWALIALLAVRAFFSVIEALGSVLTWHLYGKKKVIAQFLSVLNDSKFPVDSHSADDIQEFLPSVSNHPEIDISLRLAARELEVAVSASGIVGYLSALRTHSAVQDAYQQYRKANVRYAA